MKIETEVRDTTPQIYLAVHLKDPDTPWSSIDRSQIVLIRKLDTDIWVLPLSEHTAPYKTTHENEYTPLPSGSTFKFTQD